MTRLSAPTLDEVRQAALRIGPAFRTPLVPLSVSRDGPEVRLKLENLQPIGSFKIRGALNCMLSIPREALADGVYTASAGNMAQGVAWAARSLGVPATVIVPDTAPAAKLDAIARLGAATVRVPYDEWWQTMRDGGREGMRGQFVHPFADRGVMAGNGTIALELLEAFPDVDAILVPWGGGGLACGIASAARSLQPAVRVYACEVEGAAPLAASLRAGEPVAIENRRSFVDGIGGKSVFPPMWTLARELIADSLTVDVGRVADAVRLLASNVRVVAEGAGAAPVAAAIEHAARLGRTARVCCIVSGGNIDLTVLSAILVGKQP